MNEQVLLEGIILGDLIDEASKNVLTLVDLAKSFKVSDKTINGILCLLAFDRVLKYKYRFLSDREKERITIRYYSTIFHVLKNTLTVLREPDISEEVITWTADAFGIIGKAVIQRLLEGKELNKFLKLFKSVLLMYSERHSITSKELIAIAYFFRNIQRKEFSVVEVNYLIHIFLTFQLLYPKGSYSDLIELTRLLGGVMRYRGKENRIKLLDYIAKILDELKRFRMEEGEVGRIFRVVMPAEGNLPLLSDRDLREYLASVYKYIQESQDINEIKELSSLFLNVYLKLGNLDEKERREAIKNLGTILRYGNPGIVKYLLNNIGKQSDLLKFLLGIKNKVLGINELHNY